MKQEIIHNSIEDTLGMIELMIYRGGHNITIIHLGTDYYMQLMCEKGNNEMYCEAVSNYYLEEEAKLNEQQKSILEQMGWEINIEGNNYGIHHAVDSEKSRNDLTMLLIKTAKEVYHFDNLKVEDFSISLEN